MINKNTFDILNRLGFGADIDALETYVSNLSKSIEMGNPLVSDAEFDLYYNILRELKPDSDIERPDSKANYTHDENDKFIDEFKVDNSNMIGSTEDIIRYKQILSEYTKPINLIAALKFIGQPFRAVYINGYLVKGLINNVNIIGHLKELLPNCIDSWNGTNLVEVRGFLYINVDSINTIELEKYNSIEEMLVSILIGNPVDNEKDILLYNCYKILSDYLKFDNISEEIEELEAREFNIPEYAVLKNVTSLNIETSINKLNEYFEGLVKENGLRYTDGIIVAIDNLYDNIRNDIVTIKLGIWEDKIYESTIKEIKYIPGIEYYEPIAIIDNIQIGDKIINEISLINIGIVEKNNFVVGSTIYFKSGLHKVYVTTKDGRTIL